ncbi:MAG: HlyC/CorC family transporter [Robiginitomaculum sp.]
MDALLDMIKSWDWNIIGTALSVLFLILISAFFSGSETALTAASRARLLALEKDGDTRAGLVSKMLATPERLLGALLLGNNLVNILASALTTALFMSLFGAAGVPIATAVMTVLILIFAEVLPKTYAISQPDNAAVNVARPVSLIVKIFAPIVLAIQAIVSMVLKLFGVESDGSPWSAMDEIRGAVDLHHQEGGVAKSARDRMIGAMELGDITVEDIMIHRKNLIMVQAGLTSAQTVSKLMESGHTRVPIWRGNTDNVIGVLHAKDVLAGLSKAGGDFKKLNISRLMREPWFVPETTTAVHQLRAFQQKREHFALAVDEYGALMGVITLEDIIEEIVGDIQDEYDDEVDGVNAQAGGAVLVNGDVTLRDLNRARDWDLPDEEAVTIAGLVIHEAQTIPDIGRVFSFHGYRFEIIGKTRNQITRLKVEKTA